jgi:3-hydroxybutyryl-CoA dehydrogenase
MSIRFNSLLVVGEGKLISEISQCLLQAGHLVTEFRRYSEKQSLRDSGDSLPDPVSQKGSKFKAIRSWAEIQQIDLVVLITPENLVVKQHYLENLERSISPSTPILINTESFTLDELRLGHPSPGRILGLNWARPAHTTLFAELILLPDTPAALEESIVEMIQNQWRKDPYVLRGGQSVRAKMMAAMIREAFFLIENGYVTEEDIDRACRNDAGYYLPFAGNLRYMDLMGTYVYGVVMQDLNPELSVQQELPVFFERLLQKYPNPGLDAGRGFYSYSERKKADLEAEFLDFSAKIRQMMDKFPFPAENTAENPVGMKESMSITHKNRSL